MVLEIRLENFFSIKEEIVLDMRAANINTKKAKALSRNIFPINDKINGLKTVVMYGANASGKSNIIKAIRFCHRMVLNSHNHNESTQFNFKPYKFNGFNRKPSKYFIRFVHNSIEYEYCFSLTQNRIVEESLYYYPKGRIVKVFVRNEKKGKAKKNKYEFGAVINRPWDIAENTSDKTLFISRASQMDREIAKEVFRYFNEQFILSYLPQSISNVEVLSGKYKKTLLQALQIADSDIVDIKISKKRQVGKNYNANIQDLTLTVEDVEEEFLNITTFHRSAPSVPFNFFQEESQGTIKLFFIMLTILMVVKQNKTLLIDEIGESLHPEIIEYIFNLFKAGERAQLICTTHNTRFLDLDFFRKDQIYFVNKRQDASTDLYSLYDYKDFRDTMDLEKAYHQGRFDAVPYITDSIDELADLLQ